MTCLGIIAFPGVDELDFVGVHEVLSKASQFNAERIQVHTLGPEGIITGSCGIQFIVDKPYQYMAHCDAIVVPGGPGISVCAKDDELATMLQQHVSSRKHVYTVCTGVVLLSIMGFTRGMELAIHADKRDIIPELQDATIRRGLVKDSWLTSIGGVQRPTIKSVELGFQILTDLFPDSIPYVQRRLEVYKYQWSH